MYGQDMWGGLIGANGTSQDGAGQGWANSGGLPAGYSGGPLPPSMPGFGAPPPSMPGFGGQTQSTTSYNSRPQQSFTSYGSQPAPAIGYSSRPQSMASFGASPPMPGFGTQMQQSRQAQPYGGGYQLPSQSRAPAAPTTPAAAPQKNWLINFWQTGQLPAGYAASRPTTPGVASLSGRPFYEWSFAPQGNMPYTPKQPPPQERLGSIRPQQSVLDGWRSSY